MHLFNIRTPLNYLISTLIGITLAILLSGCSENNTSTVSSDSQTGGIAFSLECSDQADEGTMPQNIIRSSTGNVCADYLIDTIRAHVYTASGIGDIIDITPVKSASWDCSAHGGQINEIPGGKFCLVRVEGLNGTDVHWRGDTKAVFIKPGEITRVQDPVQMVWIGNDPTPPQVSTTNPADGGQSISINSEILVTFSEPIASEIDTSLFTVSIGASPIDGNVVYNTSTLTATFTPTEDLLFSETYTVTISGTLQDLEGDIIGQDKEWQFFTVASEPAWYKDADTDGYSDGTYQESATDPGDDYFSASELITTSGDCNDGDDAIHPGATEICDDTIDNNCDGNVDCYDANCTNEPICSTDESDVIGVWEECIDINCDGGCGLNTLTFYADHTFDSNPRCSGYTDTWNLVGNTITFYYSACDSPEYSGTIASSGTEMSGTMGDGYCWSAVKME